MDARLCTSKHVHSRLFTTRTDTHTHAARSQRMSGGGGLSFTAHSLLQPQTASYCRRCRHSRGTRRPSKRPLASRSPRGRGSRSGRPRGNRRRCRDVPTGGPAPGRPSCFRVSSAAPLSSAECSGPWAARPPWPCSRAPALPCQLPLLPPWADRPPGHPPPPSPSLHRATCSVPRTLGRNPPRRPRTLPRPHVPPLVLPLQSVACLGSCPCCTSGGN